MKQAFKQHQKDIRIDGRLARVWVLRETHERVLYIPLKSQHRIDYERFKVLANATPHGSDLLNHMAKSKLKNGRNALSLYDHVIQIANKQTADVVARIPRPHEPEKAFATQGQTGLQTPTQTFATQGQTGLQTQADALGQKAEADMKVESETTEPRKLAGAGITAVYKLPTSDGGSREWTAKAHGPYPAELQAQIELGRDPSEFRIK